VEIKKRTIFFCARLEEIMEQFTLKELVKRKLDETYIIVYATKNEINIKKADIIIKMKSKLEPNKKRSYPS